MQSEINIKTSTASMISFDHQDDELSVINTYVKQAWKKIAPFWPLKNLIACNPLQGLEDLSIEEAITKGKRYFQQAKFPERMEAINRETIKWCQVFFDQGQATIQMPNRNLGLYASWRKLARFDDRLKNINNSAQLLLEKLPESAEIAILDCLSKLQIPYEKRERFLTLLLTTLPGWTSYIKYRTEWTHGDDSSYNSISQIDYLAMRLVITTMLWPEAIKLLSWHKELRDTSSFSEIKKIAKEEEIYRSSLVRDLYKESVKSKLESSQIPVAQFVFCIDVRSEPFRRALEAHGNYETFGFAGFFGIPTKIENVISKECYSSCPVLLVPAHKVKEKPVCSDETYKKILQGKERINILKRLYQSMKYTFTTPFMLVETLGPWSGLWMLFKTIIPTQFMKFKKIILNFSSPTSPTKPLLLEENKNSAISLKDQCQYAENALRIMGLTKNFAPFIFFCGHGSSTENNAYSTALDCGACGGHQGDSNAKILATILNHAQVRHYLRSRQIDIPNETLFIAAKHNTTTDEVTLYEDSNTSDLSEPLSVIKKSLDIARDANCKWRAKQMGYKNKRSKNDNSINHLLKRSMDWAQTRPEWGLARNAAFIVAPRDLTKNLNLEGRAFLHSYNWEQDESGSSLTTILTAPMVVAQWINNQYFFSSLDNVAYGSGSKITHNITGKIGVMQGNGSDLMTGLPIQSINMSDNQAYHSPLRLLTVIYAPRFTVEKIISKQAILQKLFGNGWVTLTCIEPENFDIFHLERNLKWKKD